MGRVVLVMRSLLRYLRFSDFIVGYDRMKSKKKNTIILKVDKNEKIGKKVNFIVINNKYKHLNNL